MTTDDEELRALEADQAREESMANTMRQVTYMILVAMLIALVILFSSRIPN